MLFYGVRVERNPDNTPVIEDDEPVILESEINGNGEIIPTGYISNIKNINISKGINTIETCAIIGFRNLNTLIVPSTLITREESWIVLSKVNVLMINEGITEISEGEFLHSTADILEINIPKSVTFIGDGAFYYAKGLKMLNLQPDGDLVIDREAFSHCEDLEVINLQGKITANGDSFSDCEKLCKVNISNEVICIGGNCFSGCISLSEIYIPKTVRIVAWPFQDWTKNQTIYLEATEDEAEEMYDENWKLGCNANIVYGATR